MDQLTYLLEHPDDLTPQAVTLPWGAVLCVWRCTKLTSAHGAQEERVAVPTGGLEFEVTFPAPRYGPARPLTSRLRPGWTTAQAQARYLHMCARSMQETALNAARDRLFDILESYRVSPDSTSYAELIGLAEGYHLHLDVADMDWEMVYAWGRIFDLPLDNDSQVR